MGSFTADRGRPYFNIFVRDDITWEKINFSRVRFPNSDRIQYVDIWESLDGSGITRQGDRPGSTERASYPIPCGDAGYCDDQDSQQPLHSHWYTNEQNIRVLRIELPACMEMIDYRREHED
jgi:hypothetical protein